MPFQEPPPSPDELSPEERWRRRQGVENDGSLETPEQRSEDEVFLDKEALKSITEYSLRKVFSFSTKDTLQYCTRALDDFSSDSDPDSYDSTDSQTNYERYAVAYVNNFIFDFFSAYLTLQVYSDIGKYKNKFSSITWRKIFSSFEEDAKEKDSDIYKAIKFLGVESKQVFIRVAQEVQTKYDFSPKEEEI